MEGFTTKIDEEPDSEFVGFQIIQHLSHVNILQMDDCFQFDEDILFDYKVCASRTDGMDQIFVKDILLNFPGKAQVPLHHFPSQSTLVDDFLEPVSKKTVDLKCCTNDLFGDVMKKKITHFLTCISMVTKDMKIGKR